MTIFVILSNKSKSKYSSSQARCKLYKTKNESSIYNESFSAIGRILLLYPSDLITLYS